MAAENYQKKELLGLMSTGANKLCVDCNAPSPQWASVSYGTFICLECSGIHRGFGVHISFVRSITMDKWSDDQLKKMKFGGNEKFKSFIENYGANGGYTKGIGMSEKYNSWAAAQYREKLAAECSDPPTPWSPSSPPPNFGVPSRPASSQATRKSRAGAGGIGSSSLNPSRSSTPIAQTQKEQNEAFFERMGAANASRPDDLPPSQGGKYGGFGSSYEPSNGQQQQHPSFGLSSQAAPSWTEVQNNPLGALGKGWGLFSSAVVNAGKEVHESVIKPGMARANEYAAGESGEDWKKYLSTGVEGAKGAAGWMGQKAGEGWEGINHLAKDRGGLDLNESLGRLGLGGSGSGSPYGRAEDGMVDHYGAGGGETYHDDEFFESWDNHPNTGSASQSLTGSSTTSAKKGPTPSAPAKKKDDDWEEW